MGGHDELGFRDSVLGFRDSSMLQVSSMSRLARLSAKSPGFVSSVAAAETARPLERAHRFSNADIARGIVGLLASASLFIEHENQMFAALTMLLSGRGSLADALIGAVAGRAGCARAVTSTPRRCVFPGLRRCDQF
jgi:predicted nucleic-acid-binding protein